MTDADERREWYAVAIYNAADGGKGRPWWALYESDREFHRRIADAAMAVADGEQREAKERYHEGLRRADEHNNALMDEVQRYADGSERPVLWSVYNAMHLRAAHAEGENVDLRAELEQLRSRAEKAERAVNLLADAHRRAERAEAAGENKQDGHAHLNDAPVG